MTALDLYLFISDNNIEYSFIEKGAEELEIYLFVDVYLIDDFYKLLKKHDFIFEDGGWPCVFKHGYFAFEMIEFCDWFGFDYKTIFKTTK